MLSISKSHVDINSVTLSQAHEFVDFHNSCHSTKRKPEYWIWQYKNYEPDKAVFTIARDNGKLIGTQAMMPVYMRIGEECILTGKSESTLLLPEYRGKEIMKDLYEYAIGLCQERGFEFIWGFTRATKAFRKFGFSVYPLPQIFCRPGLNFAVTLASRFKKPNPLWRRIKSMGKYGLFYLKNIRHLAIPYIQQQPDYQISNEKISISQINELQNKLNMKYNSIITPCLDSKYIDWRIRKHPFLKYQEYQVLKKGILQAYAFVVFCKKTISVSDLASADEHATSLLLHRIIKDNFKRTGIFNVMINPQCTIGQNMIQLLQKFGFCPYSTSNLVVRDLSGKKHEESTNMKKWNITGLWTEGYSM
jgi:GNAT superfamily N-acetyltransferase